MHTIWNDCVAMGDTLCSFPGTLELAKKRKAEGHDVAIAWTNPDVADLFPHQKYGFHRVRGTIATNAERVSIHDMVHKGVRHPPRHQHPTAQFLAHLGFVELSTAPARPEIAFGEYDVPTHDVLIAPYILAELPRMWALDRWQAVVDDLRGRGLSVGVLCGSTIPNDHDLKKINPYGQDHFRHNHAIMRQRLANCEYIVDRNLGEVAYRMVKAGVVVTVDSGPARLAYAAGANHVLICANHVSFDWGVNPDATMIYSDISRVYPQDVIPLVLEALKIPA